MAVELKTIERVTLARVPNHCGRDRGRTIHVRLMPGTVLLRADGRRWSNAVAISWEEIYTVAMNQAAMEKTKNGR